MSILRKDPKVIRRFFTEADASEHHILIAHSQARDCWNIQLEDELNFPLDFVCKPGGKAPELINIIKDFLSSAVTNLKITGMIWQNSVRDLSLAQVESLIKGLKTTLKEHPNHKVALSECLFAPKDQEYFEHISQINVLIKEFNSEQGNAPYPLNKVGLGKKRGGKSALTEKPNRWVETENHPGQGYHLKDKTKLIKFIRKYHKTGFGAVEKQFKNTPIKDLHSKALPTPTPAFDLREKVSKRQRVDYTSSPTGQTPVLDLRFKIKNKTQGYEQEPPAYTDHSVASHEQESPSYTDHSVANLLRNCENITSDSEMSDNQEPETPAMKSLTEERAWYDNGMELGIMDPLMKEMKIHLKKERKLKKRAKAVKKEIKRAEEEMKQMQEKRNKGKRKVEEESSTSESSNSEEDSDTSSSTESE